jgi:hypothetical protein
VRDGGGRGRRGGRASAAARGCDDDDNGGEAAPGAFPLTRLSHLTHLRDSDDFCAYCLKRFDADHC